MLSLKSVKCHPLLSPSDLNGLMSYYDVSMKGYNGHVSTSNRFVLAALSPLLHAALSDVPPLAATCVILPDVSGAAIKHLLQFTHTEEKLLDESNYWDLLELMTLLNIDYTNNFFVVGPEEEEPNCDFQSNAEPLNSYSGQTATENSINVQPFLDELDATAPAQLSNVKLETIDLPVQKQVKRSLKVEGSESNAMSVEENLTTAEEYFPNTSDVSESEPIMHACQHCEKCFSSGEHLQKHMKSKHERGGCFSCDQCQYSTSVKGSLNKHIKTVHEKELNYECDMCSRKFSEKSNLVRHTDSVHLKERRFQCTLCDQAFSVKASLTTHVRLHTGEKPYCCDTCGKSFVHSSGLSSHKLMHH